MFVRDDCNIKCVDDALLDGETCAFDFTTDVGSNDDDDDDDDDAGAAVVKEGESCASMLVFDELDIECAVGIPMEGSACVADDNDDDDDDEDGDGDSDDGCIGRSSGLVVVVVVVVNGSGSAMTAATCCLSSSSAASVCCSCERSRANSSRIIADSEVKAVLSSCKLCNNCVAA